MSLSFLSSHYLPQSFSHWRTASLAGLTLSIALLAGCEKSTTEQAEQSPSSAMETEKPMAMAEDHMVATTTYGKVRGEMDDGIHVFKGIRYGADTEETRFQPPKAPEPWSDVKAANAFGNSCPQIPTGSGGGLFNSWRPDPVPALDEDCLFLNVWTPVLRDGGKRPVLVWFHGGGFRSGNGASNAYNGVRLAKRGDVVVVTVNHRLNYFGYLYLGDYGDKFADSGNVGMMDLVQSLEWVRDNIEEFGGDPDNVLIFGESGGGAKVSTMMAMDAAKGLFHRAVVQSGPAITSIELDDARKAGMAVVEKLGLSKDNIDEILTMPVAKIEEAARSAAQARRVSPVVDGRTLKRHPFLDGAPLQSADVPLLIGTTRTENSLLQGSANPALFELTWETLPAALQKVLPDSKTMEDVNAIIAAYRANDPNITAPMVHFTVTTEAGFLNRSVELADKKSQQDGASAYFYLLNWDTPVEGGKWGSPHALDIGMVFDNVAKSASMSGTGADAQVIADQMSEAWLAFAKTGNPNHKGLPEWPEYTASERATMIFDSEPMVKNDPRGPLREMLKP